MSLARMNMICEMAQQKTHWSFDLQVILILGYHRETRLLIFTLAEASPATSRELTCERVSFSSVNHDAPASSSLHTSTIHTAHLTSPQLQFLISCLSSLSLMHDTYLHICSASNAGLSGVVELTPFPVQESLRQARFACLSPLWRKNVNNKDLEFWCTQQSYIARSIAKCVASTFGDASRLYTSWLRFYTILWARVFRLPSFYSAAQGVINILCKVALTTIR